LLDDVPEYLTLFLLFHTIAFNGLSEKNFIDRIMSLCIKTKTTFIGASLTINRKSSTREKAG
jgi:hypothetical protein